MKERSFNIRNVFYNTKNQEQETIVNIDYFTSTIHIYTSRKSVYERIQRKIGEPTQVYCTNGQISGAKWAIPFTEKRKITTVLSRVLLIGQAK